MGEAAVRAILRANRFMVLGTADAEGSPWVSPVWFATEDDREFVWVSSPEVRHSRNLAARAELSIVVYDSGQAPGTGEAVYMSAEGGEVEPERLGDGVRVFARRSAEQGLREWMEQDVRAPARHRLYRAVATEHFLLGPRDERLPVRLG
jgi:hypothetical protein